jgi:hypothetical protein
MLVFSVTDWGIWGVAESGVNGGAIHGEGVGT